jgi:hypothetical protein
MARTAFPTVRNSNYFIDKFLNGSNVAVNNNNLFKKIEVKPKNVLIKPESVVKERYFDMGKANIRDKKSNSIKLLSNSSGNNSNSRLQSNSFVRPANVLRQVNPLK